MVENIDTIEKEKETEKFFIERDPFREFTKFEKQEMFEARMAELQELFDILTDEKKTLAKGVIVSVARMTVELKELELVNMKNGQVEQYNNGGGQKGNKASVTAEAYNKLKKTYLADIKFLTDLLKPADDEITPPDRNILEKFAKMK